MTTTLRGYSPITIQPVTGTMRVGDRITGDPLGELTVIAVIGRRAPKIANPNRICPECGAPFIATNGRQAYCCIEHKRSFHRTMRDRGQVLTPLVQTWRRGKHGGAPEDARYALAQLCALADLWNAEDRSAGRDAGVTVASKRAMGWIAADLI